MSADLAFIQGKGDLADRVTIANDQPVLVKGDYVLVILNRALRGEDNPVIDAAQQHAQAEERTVGCDRTSPKPPLSTPTKTTPSETEPG